ncbi:CdaR family protein [Anaerobacillus isosaccharinicus]|uniref:YbbR-like domain-containing protein n=1 Tax=Anaerobacillus isosaccharinicus TaxID=1532552 RepID=A0A1S2L8L7_9BACI|nr:CdaR family protein [Anaerobacillus isosaccharinicus]MBA5584005.1 YbbR-like domain-containing protein [Anaerobacillus isosaccharinicus]QOY37578.1 YbbR-like domain-containing protein [Anaerobacillus isosaccharinicus]
MDKLYNNPWFVKAIAFFIAVMLFAIVNFDNAGNQPGALPTITNGSYTLEEVPLNVYYNEEEYAITEMVEHVQVNLRGPQNVLTLLQIARPAYDVFIDLRNLETGTHNVNVQHRNFPNELTVNIVPQTVEVTIEEKRTISIPVDIELLNKRAIKDGYTLGTPIVNPINVEITAAESIIQQVGFAKGFVDVEGFDDSIEKSVPVKVYDQQGNELHIDVNPTVVDVKIPISSPNKDVPLKINRIGELPEGLSIKTIYADPKEVTVFGPRNVINSIDFIEGIEVDLSTITENTILEYEVPLPPGVEKVIPDIVRVVIEVEAEQAIEIDNIPLEVIGLAEQKEVAFALPEQEIITLIVKGTTATIQRLRQEDLKVYIEVSQLPVGEHVVPLQITGPQNVRYKKPFEDVRVIISEVLSAEEEESSTEAND